MTKDTNPFADTPNVLENVAAGLCLLIDINTQGEDWNADDKGGDWLTPRGRFGMCLLLQAMESALRKEMEPKLEVASLSDEINALLNAFNELPKEAQWYVLALATDIKNDEVYERITRHLNGERVSTEQIDLDTGKEIHVPKDQPLPRRAVPLLGEIS